VDANSQGAVVGFHREVELELVEIRAELAEDEVERLRQSWTEIHEHWSEEWDLADRLAEWIRRRCEASGESTAPLVLQAWELRRNRCQPPLLPDRR
jgi:hypothetical protein